MAPVLANRRQIYLAAMPRPGRVTLRSNSSGRFIQILTNQNYINIDTEIIWAKGVKDQVCSSYIKLEIYISVIRHPEESRNT
jgi:hypothetical protein